MEESTGKKTLQVWQCVLLLVIAVFVVLFGIVGLKAKPVVCLVSAGMLVSLLGMAFGVRWADIEEDMKETVKRISVAVLILLFVGLMVGSWMISGTVPFMMYYGLKFLPPSIFLVATILLCALMSIMTGTSWGTMSTIGIALMGVSTGLGIPLPYTAGCVITGAIFGDKLSPLSDTTILAPAMSGVDIMDHIKSMLFTTVPSLVVGLIMAFFLGLRFSGGTVDGEQYQLIMNTLSANFHMNPLLLLPPLVVLFLIFRQKPTLPVFAVGIFLGVILAVAVQGESLSATLTALYKGFTGDTGVDIVNSMVQRGGATSMFDSIGLIIGAAVFGAPLQTLGITDVLLSAITKFAKNSRILMVLSYLLHMFLFCITGAYYVTFAVVGPVLGPLYDKYDLHRKNLSRMLEDSGTAFGPLVPWSNVGAFCATTLGVPVFAYALYAPITYCSLLFALIYIITGFGVFRRDGTMLLRKKKGDA